MLEVWKENLMAQVKIQTISVKMTQNMPTGKLAVTKMACCINFDDRDGNKIVNVAPSQMKATNHSVYLQVKLWTLLLIVYYYKLLFNITFITLYNCWKIGLPNYLLWGEESEQHWTNSSSEIQWCG